MAEKKKIGNSFTHEDLRYLDQRLSFALYTSSKAMTRAYKPLLDPFHLTYTGYLTMLALWERDHVTVKALGERLTLDSGTLTPVLKKLEALSYVERVRSSEDERTVIISLTEAGRALEQATSFTPEQALRSVGLTPGELLELIDYLRYLTKRLAQSCEPKKS